MLGGGRLNSSISRSPVVASRESSIWRFPPQGVLSCICRPGMAGVDHVVRVKTLNGVGELQSCSRNVLILIWGFIRIIAKERSVQGCVTHIVRRVRGIVSQLAIKVTMWVELWRMSNCWQHLECLVL